MTSDSPGQHPVNAGFAERLLEVIDSGRRTATYKLALLLAMLDLCAGTATRTDGRRRCCIPGTSRIRCGIDAVENLVLADRRCNNDKRDLLPGPRTSPPGPAATSTTTPRSPAWPPPPGGTLTRPLTKAVARSIYSHLPSGATPLWLGYKHVGTADPATAVAALSQRRTAAKCRPRSSRRWEPAEPSRRPRPDPRRRSTRGARLTE